MYIQGTIMSQEQWNVVDDYFAALFTPTDPVLEQVLHASDSAGLSQINVASNQGKLLHILARSCGAKRILEVGTLGGYSTIWLARALPTDGKLITLEYDPKHAEVAQRNITNAGLADIVEVRVGKAIELLPVIAAEGHPPFDLVFIDADKVSTPGYLEWAVRLTRPGSLIIVDNVVRRGAVIEAESDDPNVQGIRGALEFMSTHPRLTTTALQTVGSKGYDGLAIAIVME
jgi:predicted O-methyltransferase YrrM